MRAAEVVVLGLEVCRHRPLGRRRIVAGDEPRQRGVLVDDGAAHSTGSIVAIT